jgi:hypothetical protein
MKKKEMANSAIKARRTTIALLGFVQVTTMISIQGFT